MRIWDLPPALLCRQHLLGEHRELHGLWVVLTQARAGYRGHPETRRWVGRLAALYNRHEVLVSEMLARGYQHRSPLDASLATDLSTQDQWVDSPTDQYKILYGRSDLLIATSPASASRIGWVEWVHANRYLYPTTLEVASFKSQGMEREFCKW